MSANTRSEKRAAVLWDESFLWGLVACRALKKAGLDFSLINANDIRQGALADYRLLYVPGGWASNKLKALGEQGAMMIKRFIERGGSYFGVCGGAGLATSEGLGLLPIKRKPLEQRVPSLSGKITAAICPHPVWKGISGPRAKFHIWWPSQMEPGKNDKSMKIKILAAFDAATEDTFSSDLSVADTPDIGRMERAYGLNLDPGRMCGSPLVMEGAYGAGRVFISLIHFDTPGDVNGRRALKNLWDFFGCGRAICPEDKNKKQKNGRAGGRAARKFLFSVLSEPVEELYQFGLRNFLWFPRGWVIQWRRGVRGLEYFTLREMVREMASSPGAGEISAGEIEALAGGLRNFCEKAKKLLMQERLALQEGRAITFSNASSDEMAELRMELFSGSKSHGGQFKILLDKIDALLCRALKAEELHPLPTLSLKGEGLTKGGIAPLVKSPT